MSSNPGRYIVVEGIDGSGKTTQFNNLLQHIKNAVGVREPGGTPMGEHIRTILKDRTIPRGGEANTLLFAAARADLVESVIRPTIASGKHVVADRNWLSTYAYQSAEGVDTEKIITLNRIATAEFFEPDLVLLLDIDPRVCEERTKARGGAETDYFDSKGSDYFTRVRSAYLTGVKQLANGIIIDANGTPEQVWHRIEQHLTERGIV